MIPDEIVKKATSFIHKMQENAYKTSDVREKVLDYYESQYRSFLDQFEDGSSEKNLYLAFYHFCMRSVIFYSKLKNMKERLILFGVFHSFTDGIKYSSHYSLQIKQLYKTS